mgnify:CR=1 FL=1
MGVHRKLRAGTIEYAVNPSDMKAENSAKAAFIEREMPKFDRVQKNSPECIV